MREDCFTLCKTPQENVTVTFFTSTKGGDPYQGDTLFLCHSQFLCYMEQKCSFLAQLEEKGYKVPPSACVCNRALIVLGTADTPGTCPNLSWLRWFQTEKWFCCTEKYFTMIRRKYLLNFVENTQSFDPDAERSWKRISIGSDFFFFLILLMHCKSSPNHRMDWRHHTAKLFLVPFGGYKGKVRRQILYEEVSEHKVILIQPFFFQGAIFSKLWYFLQKGHFL